MEKRSKLFLSFIHVEGPVVCRQLKIGGLVLNVCQLYVSCPKLRAYLKRHNQNLNKSKTFQFTRQKNSKIKNNFTRTVGMTMSII